MYDPVHFTIRRPSNTAFKSFRYISLTQTASAKSFLDHGTLAESVNPYLAESFNLLSTTNTTFLFSVVTQQCIVFCQAVSS